MAVSQHPSDWSVDNSVSTSTGPTHHQESLSTALAEMLAKMKGVEPTQEGFNLFEYIDSDALDSLSEHAKGHENAAWRLEFEAGDEFVIVRSDGFIKTTGGELRTEQ